MRKALTIAAREVAGFFVSPAAYLIIALFLLADGYLFFFDSPVGEAIFRPGAEATLRPMLNLLARAMVIVAPLLTMRLLAEPLGSGAIETLMTAPVTEAQVIAGKFLGAMVCYAAVLATTGLHLATIAAFARPDWAVAAVGYAGLLLLGGAFVSVGLFASALTQHQLLAAVAAAALLAAMTFGADLLAVRLGAPLNHAAAAINALRYYDDFSKGVLDVRALAFFGAVAGVFLLAATLTLESRRWR